MRDTTTVMGLILDIAKNDNRIRAVFQTGSRVNPLVNRDIMQDYDIIYCVQDVEAFKTDESFLEAMGEPILVHKPDAMKTLGRTASETFLYSCLYEDGVKVDFKFYPVEKITNLMTTETLLLLLMDKDNLIQQLAVSSDVGYRAGRATKNEFEEVTAEFFYRVVEMTPYLYRKQTIGGFYAYRELMDMLNRMLSWYIANEKDYKVNLGKNYRDIAKNLDDEYRNIYIDVYPSMDPEEFWRALFAACTLFRKLGLTLAERLGYNYPRQTDVRVSAHIRKVWQQAKKARIQ